MNRLISSLFGAAIICSCLTAGATPPMKVEIAPFDVFGQYIGDCGDFNILSDYSGWGHTTLHYDKDGNLTRQFDHVKFESVYYSSTDVNRTNELRGSGELENLHWTYIGDPPTLAVSGTSFQLTVPGYGVVLIRTGVMVWDLNTFELLHQAGPSTFDEEGGFDALCSALTP